MKGQTRASVERVGMPKGTATLENSLVISYKVKPILTPHSSHCGPR